MKLNDQILLTAAVTSLSICFAISVFVKSEKEASINALNIQYIETIFDFARKNKKGQKVEKSHLTFDEIDEMTGGYISIEFVYTTNNDGGFIDGSFKSKNVKSLIKPTTVKSEVGRFIFVTRYSIAGQWVYEYTKPMVTNSNVLLHVGVKQKASLQYLDRPNIYVYVIYIFSVFSVCIAALFWARRLTRLIQSSADNIQALSSYTFDGERLRDDAEIIRTNAAHSIPEFHQLINAIQLMAESWDKTLKETTKNEQYWRATLNSIGDGVITTDALGVITQLNRVAEEMTGWGSLEATGKSLETVFSLHDSITKNRIKLPITDIVSSGSSVRFHDSITLIRKDGEEYQVSDSIAAIDDENGLTEGVVVVFHDDTEQYSLRKKIRNANARLNGILNDMQTMVGIIDLDGKLVYANNTPIKITGVSLEDVLNKTFSEAVWFDFDENLMALIQHEVDTALNGKSTLSEYQVYTLGGLLWVSVAMHPVIDSDGVVIEVVAEAHDISARKRTEEHLRRSQKMEALGKLTGGIAHDYNNMLGVIQGYAELLEDELGDYPELRNYTTQIINASERSVNITSKLLNFSRKESIKSSVVNINDILREQRGILEKAVTVSITLELSLTDALWTAVLEISDFEDAVLNLSINCMHAIGNHPGGFIRLVSENNYVNADTAHTLQLTQGEYVTLKVSDNGCGMSASTRQRIFEPFFTTKGDKGTGLGLSQVYSFVKRNKGAISVYSEEGRGTEFVMYFPRNNATTTKARYIRDGSSDNFGTESVLVVDDEPALVELASKILTKNGYKVFTANSSKQALLLLANTPIDLLLSDVVMPDMDGYELAAIVRQKHPLVRIQMASGFTSDRHVKDRDVANDYIIAKPYRKNTLLIRVRSVLDSDIVDGGSYEI